MSGDRAITAGVFTAELAGGATAQLKLRAEYEVTWHSPADARRDRQARMGLTRVETGGRHGPRLIFHGSPKFGAQELDPRWISEITEVPYDSDARHIEAVPRQRGRQPGPAEPGLEPLRVDSMLRVVRSYAPDAAAKDHCTTLAAEAAGDGYTPDQVVAMIAGWLIDGLRAGNWPWGRRLRFTEGEPVEFRDRTRGARWEPGTFVRYDAPGNEHEAGPQAIVAYADARQGRCRTEVARIRPRQDGGTP